MKARIINKKYASDPAIYFFIKINLRPIRVTNPVRQRESKKGEASLNKMFIVPY